MDLIICASISRFARNFSDCMTQIAALKTMHPAHPIGVYFETENIYTLNPKVADRANITLRQYQRLESGERNFLTSSFGLACRVIEALDMDVSKFYHGDYYLEELKTIEGK